MDDIGAQYVHFILPTTSTSPTLSTSLLQNDSNLANSVSNNNNKNEDVYDESWKSCNGINNSNQLVSNRTWQRQIINKLWQIKRLIARGSTPRKNFIIDSSTAHGDVILTESAAMKPGIGWITLHVTEGIRKGVHEWGIKIEQQGETADGSGLMLGLVPRLYTKFDSFISQGGGWCISRAGKFYGHWRRLESSNTTTLSFGTGDCVIFTLDYEHAKMTVRVKDKFVIGEISDLNGEVFPAISLHYRHQHIRFEYHTTEEAQSSRVTWLSEQTMPLPASFLPMTIAQLHNTPLMSYLYSPFFTLTQCSLQNSAHNEWEQQHENWITSLSLPPLQDYEQTPREVHFLMLMQSFLETLLSTSSSFLSNKEDVEKENSQSEKTNNVTITNNFDKDDSIVNSNNRALIFHQAMAQKISTLLEQYRTFTSQIIAIYNHNHRLSLEQYTSSHSISLRCTLWSNAFRAICQYALQWSHKPHFLTLERSAMYLHNYTRNVYGNSNAITHNAQVANNIHQFITNNDNNENNNNSMNEFMFLGNTLGLINNTRSNYSNNSILMNCGAYIIVHMFASMLAKAVQQIKNNNNNNSEINNTSNDCLASQMSLPLLESLKSYLLSLPPFALAASVNNSKDTSSVGHALGGISPEIFKLAIKQIAHILEPALNSTEPNCHLTNSSSSSASMITTPINTKLLSPLHSALMELLVIISLQQGSVSNVLYACDCLLQFPQMHISPPLHQWLQLHSASFQPPQIIPDMVQLMHNTQSNIQHLQECGNATLTIRNKTCKLHNVLSFVIGYGTCEQDNEVNRESNVELYLHTTEGLHKYCSNNNSNAEQLEESENEEEEEEMQEFPVELQETKEKYKFVLTHQSNEPEWLFSQTRKYPSLTSPSPFAISSSSSLALTSEAVILLQPEIMYSAGVAFVSFSRLTLTIMKVYMLHDHAITRLLHPTSQVCNVSNNKNSENCADGSSISNNNTCSSCSSNSKGNVKIMQIINGKNDELFFLCAMTSDVPMKSNELVCNSTHNVISRITAPAQEQRHYNFNTSKAAERKLPLSSSSSTSSPPFYSPSLTTSSTTSKPTNATKLMMRVVKCQTSYFSHLSEPQSQSISEQPLNLPSNLSLLSSWTQTNSYTHCLAMRRGGYVLLGSPEGSLHGVHGHVTVELWIMLLTTEDATILYQHGNKSVSGEVFIELVKLEGCFCVRGGFRHETRGASVVISPWPMSVGSGANHFTHIALVYDGRWHLYFNGKEAHYLKNTLDSSNGNNLSAQVGLASPVQKWMLGAETETCSCLIAAVRIWRGARSGQELARDALSEINAYTEKALLVVQLNFNEIAGNVCMNSSYESASCHATVCGNCTRVKYTDAIHPWQGSNYIYGANHLQQQEQQNVEFTLRSEQLYNGVNTLKGLDVNSKPNVMNLVNVLKWCDETSIRGVATGNYLLLRGVLLPNSPFAVKCGILFVYFDSCTGEPARCMHLVEYSNEVAKLRNISNSNSSNEYKNSINNSNSIATQKNKYEFYANTIKYMSNDANGQLWQLYEIPSEHYNKHTKLGLTVLTELNQALELSEFCSNSLQSRNNISQERFNGSSSQSDSSRTSCMSYEVLGETMLHTLFTFAQERNNFNDEQNKEYNNNNNNNNNSSMYNARNKSLGYLFAPLRDEVSYECVEQVHAILTNHFRVINSGNARRAVSLKSSYSVHLLTTALQILQRLLIRLKEYELDPRVVGIACDETLFNHNESMEYNIKNDKTHKEKLMSYLSRNFVLDEEELANTENKRACSINSCYVESRKESMECQKMNFSFLEVLLEISKEAQNTLRCVELEEAVLHVLYDGLELFMPSSLDRALLLHRLLSAQDKDVNHNEAIRVAHTNVETTKTSESKNKYDSNNIIRRRDETSTNSKQITKQRQWQETTQITSLAPSSTASRISLMTHKLIRLLLHSICSLENGTRLISQNMSASFQKENGDEINNTAETIQVNDESENTDRAKWPSIVLAEIVSLLYKSVSRSLFHVNDNTYKCIASSNLSHVRVNDLNEEQVEHMLTLLHSIHVLQVILLSAFCNDNKNNSSSANASSWDARQWHDDAESEQKYNEHNYYSDTATHVSSKVECVIMFYQQVFHAIEHLCIFYQNNTITNGAFCMCQFNKGNTYHLISSFVRCLRTALETIPLILSLCVRTKIMEMLTSAHKLLTASLQLMKEKVQIQVNASNDDCYSRDKYRNTTDSKREENIKAKVKIIELLSIIHEIIQCHLMWTAVYLLEPHYDDFTVCNPTLALQQEDEEELREIFRSVFLSSGLRNSYGKEESKYLQKVTNEKYKNKEQKQQQQQLHNEAELDKRLLHQHYSFRQDKLICYLSAQSDTYWCALQHSLDALGRKVPARLASLMAYMAVSAIYLSNMCITHMTTEELHEQVRHVVQRMNFIRNELLSRRNTMTHKVNKETNVESEFDGMLRDVRQRCTLLLQEVQTPQDDLTYYFVEGVHSSSENHVLWSSDRATTTTITFYEKYDKNIKRVQELNLQNEQKEVIKPDNNVKDDINKKEYYALKSNLTKTETKNPKACQRWNAVYYKLRRMLLWNRAHHLTSTNESLSNAIAFVARICLSTFCTATLLKSELKRRNAIALRRIHALELLINLMEVKQQSTNNNNDCSKCDKKQTSNCMSIKTDHNSLWQVNRHHNLPVESLHILNSIVELMTESNNSAEHSKCHYLDALNGCSSALRHALISHMHHFIELVTQHSHVESAPYANMERISNKNISEVKELRSNESIESNNNVYAAERRSVMIQKFVSVCKLLARTWEPIDFNHLCETNLIDDIIQKNLSIFTDTNLPLLESSTNCNYRKDIANSIENSNHKDDERLQCADSIDKPKSKYKEPKQNTLVNVNTYEKWIEDCHQITLQYFYHAYLQTEHKAIMRTAVDKLMEMTKKSTPSASSLPSTWSSSPLLAREFSNRMESKDKLYEMFAIDYTSREEVEFASLQCLKQLALQCIDMLATDDINCTDNVNKSSKAKSQEGKKCCSCMMQTKKRKEAETTNKDNNECYIGNSNRRCCSVVERNVCSAFMTSWFDALNTELTKCFEELLSKSNHKTEINNTTTAAPESSSISNKSKNDNDTNKINNTPIKRYNNDGHNEIGHHVRELISLISVIAAAYVKCVSYTPHSLAVSMSQVSRTLVRFVQYWHCTLSSSAMHSATDTIFTHSSMILTCSSAIRTSIHLIQHVNPDIANEVYFNAMQKKEINKGNRNPNDIIDDDDDSTLALFRSINYLSKKELSYSCTTTQQGTNINNMKISKIAESVCVVNCATLGWLTSLVITHIYEYGVDLFATHALHELHKLVCHSRWAAELSHFAKNFQSDLNSLIYCVTDLHSNKEASKFFAVFSSNNINKDVASKNKMKQMSANERIINVENLHRLTSIKVYVWLGVIGGYLFHPPGTGLPVRFTASAAAASTSNKQAGLNGKSDSNNNNNNNSDKENPMDTLYSSNVMRDGYFLHMPLSSCYSSSANDQESVLVVPSNYDSLRRKEEFSWRFHRVYANHNNGDDNEDEFVIAPIAQEQLLDEQRHDGLVDHDYDEYVNECCFYDASECKTGIELPLEHLSMPPITEPTLLTPYVHLVSDYIIPALQACSSSTFLTRHRTRHTQQSNEYSNNNYTNINKKEEKGKENENKHTITYFDDAITVSLLHLTLSFISLAPMSAFRELIESDVLKCLTTEGALRSLGLPIPLSHATEFANHTLSLISMTEVECNKHLGRNTPIHALAKLCGAFTKNIQLFRKEQQLELLQESNHELLIKAKAQTDEHDVSMELKNSQAAPTRSLLSGTIMGFPDELRKLEHEQKEEEQREQTNTITNNTTESASPPFAFATSANTHDRTRSQSPSFTVTRITNRSVRNELSTSNVNNRHSREGSNIRSDNNYSRGVNSSLSPSAHTPTSTTNARNSSAMVVTTNNNNNNEDITNAINALRILNGMHEERNNLPHLLHSLGNPSEITSPNNSLHGHIATPLAPPLSIHPLLSTPHSTQELNMAPEYLPTSLPFLTSSLFSGQTPSSLSSHLLQQSGRVAQLINVPLTESLNRAILARYTSALTTSSGSSSLLTLPLQLLPPATLSSTPTSSSTITPPLGAIISSSATTAAALALLRSNVATSSLTASRDNLLAPMLCFPFTHATEEAYVHFTSKNVNALQQDAPAAINNHSHAHGENTIDKKSSHSSSKSRSSSNSYSSVDSASKEHNSPHVIVVKVDDNVNNKSSKRDNSDNKDNSKEEQQGKKVKSCVVEELSVPSEAQTNKNLEEQQEEKEYEEAEQQRREVEKITDPTPLGVPVNFPHWTNGFSFEMSVMCCDESLFPPLCEAVPCAFSKSGEWPNDTYFPLLSVYYTPRELSHYVTESTPCSDATVSPLLLFQLEFKANSLCCVIKAEEIDVPEIECALPLTENDANKFNYIAVIIDAHSLTLVKGPDSLKTILPASVASHMKRVLRQGEYTIDVIVGQRLRDGKHENEHHVALKTHEILSQEAVATIQGTRETNTLLNIESINNNNTQTISSNNSVSRRMNHVTTSSCFNHNNRIDGNSEKELLSDGKMLILSGIRLKGFTQPVQRTRALSELVRRNQSLPLNEIDFNEYHFQCNEGSGAELHCLGWSTTGHLHGAAKWIHWPLLSLTSSLESSLLLSNRDDRLNTGPIRSADDDTPCTHSVPHSSFLSYLRSLPFSGLLQMSQNVFDTLIELLSIHVVVKALQRGLSIDYEINCAHDKRNKMVDKEKTTNVLSYKHHKSRDTDTESQKSDNDANINSYCHFSPFHVLPEHHTINAITRLFKFNPLLDDYYEYSTSMGYLNDSSVELMNVLMQSIVSCHAEHHSEEEEEEEINEEQIQTLNEFCTESVSTLLNVLHSRALHVHTTLPIPHNDLNFVNNLASQRIFNSCSNNNTSQSSSSSSAGANKAKTITPVLPLWFINDGSGVLSFCPSTSATATTTNAPIQVTVFKDVQQKSVICKLPDNQGGWPECAIARKSKMVYVKLFAPSYSHVSSSSTLASTETELANKSRIELLSLFPPFTSSTSTSSSVPVLHVELTTQLKSFCMATLHVVFAALLRALRHLVHTEQLHSQLLPIFCNAQLLAALTTHTSQSEHWEECLHSVALLTLIFNTWRVFPQMMPHDHIPLHILLSHINTPLMLFLQSNQRMNQWNEGNAENTNIGNIANGSQVHSLLIPSVLTSNCFVQSLYNMLMSAVQLEAAWQSTTFVESVRSRWHRWMHEWQRCVKRTDRTCNKTNESRRESNNIIDADNTQSTVREAVKSTSRHVSVPSSSSLSSSSSLQLQHVKSMMPNAKDKTDENKNNRSLSLHLAKQTHKLSTSSSSSILTTMPSREANKIKININVNEETPLTTSVQGPSVNHNVSKDKNKNESTQVVKTNTPPNNEHSNAQESSIGNKNSSRRNVKNINNNDKVTYEEEAEFITNTQLDLIMLAANSSALSANSPFELPASQKAVLRKGNGVFRLHGEQRTCTFCSNIGCTSGRFYFEVKICELAANSSHSNNNNNTTSFVIGCMTEKSASWQKGMPIGHDDYSWGFDALRLCKFNSAYRTDFKSRVKWKKNDVIGIYIDVELQQIICMHNERQVSSFDTFASHRRGTLVQNEMLETDIKVHGLFPAITCGANCVCEINFGAAHFTNPLLRGYCTLDPSYYWRQNICNGLWLYILSEMLLVKISLSNMIDSKENTTESNNNTANDLLQTWNINNYKTNGKIVSRYYGDYCYYNCCCTESFQDDSVAVANKPSVLDYKHELHKKLEKEEESHNTTNTTTVEGVNTKYNTRHSSLCSNNLCNTNHILEIVLHSLEPYCTDRVGPLLVNLLVNNTYSNRINDINNINTNAINSTENSSSNNNNSVVINGNRISNTEGVGGAIGCVSIRNGSWYYEVKIVQEGDIYAGWIATNAAQDCVIDNIHSINRSDNNTSSNNRRSNMGHEEDATTNFTNMDVHTTLPNLKDKLFNPDSPSWTLDIKRLNIMHYPTIQATNYQHRYTYRVRANDILGCYLDCESGVVRFAINGIELTCHVPLSESWTSALSESEYQYEKDENALYCGSDSYDDDDNNNDTFNSINSNSNITTDKYKEKRKQSRNEPNVFIDLIDVARSVGVSPVIAFEGKGSVRVCWDVHDQVFCNCNRWSQNEQTNSSENSYVKRVFRPLGGMNALVCAVRDAFLQKLCWSSKSVSRESKTKEIAENNATKASQKVCSKMNECNDICENRKPVTKIVNCLENEIYVGDENEELNEIKHFRRGNSHWTTEKTINKMKQIIKELTNSTKFTLNRVDVHCAIPLYNTRQVKKTAQKSSNKKQIPEKEICAATLQECEEMYNLASLISVAYSFMNCFASEYVLPRDFKSITLLHSTFPLHRELYCNKEYYLSSWAITSIENRLRCNTGVSVDEVVKLTLDRRQATNILKSNDVCMWCKLERSLFGQVFRSLVNRDVNLFRSNKKLWSVQFVGEGSDDVGGPYRECLSQMCQELMSGQLPLFVPCANQLAEVGDGREKFVINPLAKTRNMLNMYQFVGRWMAGCLRSGEPISLQFSDNIYKAIVNDNYSTNDLKHVDLTTWHMLEEVQKIVNRTKQGKVNGKRQRTLVTQSNINCTESKNYDRREGLHEFDAISPDSFVTNIDNKNIIEIIENGRCITVQRQNAEHYVRLMYQFKLEESITEQLQALCRGFYDIIPYTSICHLRWFELEQLICGYDDYDPADLLEKAEYENINNNDRRVLFLRSILSRFSTRQRKMFLKFLTGRETLAQNIRIRIIPDNMHDQVNEYDMSRIANPTIYEQDNRMQKDIEEEVNESELKVRPKDKVKVNEIPQENCRKLTTGKQKEMEEQELKKIQEKRKFGTNDTIKEKEEVENQTLIITEVDRRLPHASTCFYWLSLPNYSSEEVMYDRLLYAISNCAEMDADYRIHDSDDYDERTTQKIIIQDVITFQNILTKRKRATTQEQL